ncbi:NAD and Zn-dependent alcohol dehydrogenase [Mucor mucedo]|uniref:NAD and Zn-dependent alcohol dehydrogenase n=1 Tax=Mucor mucedo TaxID=29922 RepID=UPI0022211273|nr:NAD and Zn-dependent alcohol dehydrogenase [Mucor mucedo]KAI7889488.1 NAD and Zn-dependent alcohol dehydrogenase [Mucor mucedo]
MSSQDTFTGYAVTTKGGKLEPMELNLRSWNDDMIDMDVICCGVCGTDVHTIDEGWGPTEFPCVAGHEIIGTVTRVGKNVSRIKVGDRCGVGCQSASCGECDYCKKGMENLCAVHAVWSFNDRYDDTKEKAYGGFAKKWRGPAHFAVHIPDEFSSEVAASFLCGGVTTYAPLKRYNVGPGSKVAVLGVGGLGHFACQWAKAMGATVIGFDVIPNKVDDAKKLGCDDYVLFQKEEQVEPHYNTFTHIIATKIVNKCWDQYLKLLKNNGVFIQCDIPEVPLSGISGFVMAGKQLTIAASFIGSPSDIQECLDFASKHGVRTWVNTFPMDQINEAIEFVREAKPRYRAVVMN